MYFLNGYGYLEAQGNHINQSIWAYSGSPCNAWIEEGLTQGYQGNIWYTWYWAYSNTSGYYQDFAAGTTTPNGTNHTYQLEFNGNGTYGAYRDSGLVGSVGGLGAGTCTAQTGQEVSQGMLPYVHSDTFNMNPLQWQSMSGTWNYGWNTSQYWIDNPCGGGYSPPNCQNGTFYGASEWADNKP